MSNTAVAGAGDTATLLASVLAHPAAVRQLAAALQPAMVRPPHVVRLARTYEAGSIAREQEHAHNALERHCEGLTEKLLRLALARAVETARDTGKDPSHA